MIGMLPWQNEEDDDASGRTTRDETFTTTKSSSVGVKNSLTEKQEREICVHWEALLIWGCCLDWRKWTTDINRIPLSQGTCVV